MSLSLDYNNVKSELSSVIREITQNEIGFSMNIIEEQYPEMESYCQNNTEFIFDDGFSGQIFIIPCEVVLKGPEEILEYSINDIIEKVYYKDYECTLVDCLKDIDTSFFLVSEKARNYWKNKFYFILMLSLFLVVLVFFLIENKFNLFVSVGLLLTISSLPFMKLNWVLSFVSDKFFLWFFKILFSKSHTTFLIVFSAGLFIFVFGLLLNFFKVGFKISEFFSGFQRQTKGESREIGKEKKPEVSDSSVSKNDVREVVKEEISKSKRVNENKSGNIKNTQKRKKTTSK